MKKHTLEFLQKAYSVEDGTCFVTGPGWALPRNLAPSRARAGKASAGKSPGLNMRATRGVRPVAGK